MGFRDKFTVKPGDKVALDKINTRADGGLDKDATKKIIARNQARINELQELLYAERKQSLLIVLQGMDAGGKDGTIKTVADAMNPQCVVVHSYKAPNTLELSHDFLWRIHRDTPAKGLVSVFNRSHYEDVLIVRVRGLIPEEKWKQRYKQINDFEQMLTENGTHILKFFLHLGKEEQLARFKDRLDDPSKHWKITELDFSEREKWDDYQRAYEDALSKCSTEAAPWHIIPADRKWYRDLVVSQIVVDYLEGLNMQYPKPEVDADAMRKKYYPPATPKPEAPK